MELFRIKSLRIKDNEIFRKEINFEFSRAFNGRLKNGPYFTLVLGPNGTGKSNLLKILIEIFRLAYEKKVGKEDFNYLSGKYCLEYVLGESTYAILNSQSWSDRSPVVADDSTNRVQFMRDGTEIEASKIRIPNSILAMSIMLTDKYLFLKNNFEYPIYKYLGVRRDTNTAGTRSFIAKTIDHIFAASGNVEFIKNLSEMLRFLDLGREFYISYSPRYKQHLFLPELTVSKFEDFFRNYKKYLPTRTTEPWSVAAFKHLKQTEPKLIPKLVELLRHLSKRLETFDNSRSQYFEFNIFDISPSLQKLFPLLPYLHRLNIISYPEITLKKDRHYGIGESSSGEYHFISTIVGLLATISKNSLVLIDEPEISLHPNWQMKYIAFLNKVFERNRSIHIVICSHSHFMVSDLKPENSSIVALNRELNDIKATSIESNTFGWSAEEVLYSVFNARTVRNSFLEQDLTKLLGMISQNSKDKIEIERLIRRIEPLSLSQDDPLNEVISEARNFLNTND